MEYGPHRPRIGELWKVRHPIMTRGLWIPAGGVFMVVGRRRGFLAPESVVIWEGVHGFVSDLCPYLEKVINEAG